MRKVLATVAVSTALVMGGAVAASAAGIEMEGSIRIRGLSEQQIGTTAGGANSDKSPVNAYDQQVRVGMQAKPSDNLTGYLLLETGSSTGDTFTWGNETSATLFKGGAKTAGSGDNTLGIIQAYITYKPTDFGLKIGHMPVAPGTKQFINHDNTGDDAIYVTYDPNKNFHAHLATVKLQENTTNDNSDDLDAYALVMTNKFNDNFKAGFNLIHIKGADEKDSNAVAAKSTSVTFTDVNSNTPAGLDDDTFTFVSTAASASTMFPGMALTNLGLDASYKIDNLTLAGDINLQFGTIQDLGTGVAGEIDADGYAFQLSADYKIDNSSVGLLFAQGSGVDPDGATATDSVGNAFVSFLGDSAYQVYIPGYRKMVPGSFQSALGLADGNNGGLSNLTLYQLRANTATTCPLTGKKLAIRGALSYMQTTEDVANYAGNREDEIGTELDIVAAWSLTSNLTYQIEAAYLFTGDVYKTAATGAGSDPEDAYFLRHGITMKF